MNTNEKLLQEFKDATGHFWPSYESGGFTVNVGCVLEDSKDGKHKYGETLVWTDRNGRASLFSIPHEIYCALRHCAGELLVKDGWPEDQGIGSSDVNGHINEAAHELFF